MHSDAQEALVATSPNVAGGGDPLAVLEALLDEGLHVLMLAVHPCHQDSPADNIFGWLDSNHLKE